MEKEVKLKILKDRLAKLQNNDKENFGVQRKLEREIRKKLMFTFITLLETPCFYGVIFLPPSKKFCNSSQKNAIC